MKHTSRSLIAAGLLLSSAAPMVALPPLPFILLGLTHLGSNVGGGLENRRAAIFKAAGDEWDIFQETTALSTLSGQASLSDENKKSTVTIALDDKNVKWQLSYRKSEEALPLPITGLDFKRARLSEDISMPSAFTTIATYRSQLQKTMQEILKIAGEQVIARIQAKQDPTTGLKSKSE